MRLTNEPLKHSWHHTTAMQGQIEQRRQRALGKRKDLHTHAPMSKQLSLWRRARMCEPGLLDSEATLTSAAT